MSGSSICDVCRVRVSHRRQSLDEHKASVHGATPTKGGAEKTKTTKSEKEMKKKEVKKVEKTTLKRKAEAISTTKKQNSSTTLKRAKPSPTQIPAPAPPPIPTTTSQPKITTPVVEKKEADKLIDLSMLDEEKTPPRQPALVRLPAKEKEPAVQAVVCPVCSSAIASTSELAINQHIDECLSMNFLKEEEQAQQARREEQRSKVVDSSLDDSRGTEEEEDDDDEEEEEGMMDAVMKQLFTPAVTKPKPTTTPTPTPQQQRPQQPPPPLQRLQQQSPFTPTLSPASVPRLEQQREHLRQLTSLIEKQLNGTPAPPAVPINLTAAPVLNAPVPTPLFRKAEPPKVNQQQAPTAGRSTVLDRKLDKECSICFEDFVPGTEVCWLECLCVYHTQCISEWFEKRGSHSCPLHSDN